MWLSLFASRAFHRIPKSSFPHKTANVSKLHFKLVSEGPKNVFLSFTLVNLTRVLACPPQLEREPTVELKRFIS